MMSWPNLCRNRINRTAIFRYTSSHDAYHSGVVVEIPLFVVDALTNKACGGQATLFSTGKIVV